MSFQEHDALWVTAQTFAPLKLNNFTPTVSLICYTLTGCPLGPLDIRRLTLSYALSWFDNTGNETHPTFLREICAAAGTSEQIVR
jgi:hypothetical protein